jgi:hypothetical protein
MADYSKAEKYCPQKIHIGIVLKKTYEDLTWAGFAHFVFMIYA